jgi:phage-related protein
MRPLFWIASSHKDLDRLPDRVQNSFGFALYLAQCGEKAEVAKPLKGFGGAGVLEVVAHHDGDTFRAVYIVRFTEAVYVLHCFQKKSKTRATTPKQEIDLVRSRLKIAEEEYKQWQERKKRPS